MSLRSGLFVGLDALLVQTREHLKAVQVNGMHGAVVTHPHFNFGGWSPKTMTRVNIAEVGILVGDPVYNMPDDDTLQELADACCELGAELKLVLSEQAPDCPALNQSCTTAQPPLRVVDARNGTCATSPDKASARLRKCR